MVIIGPFVSYSKSSGSTYSFSTVFSNSALSFKLYTILTLCVYIVGLIPKPPSSPSYIITLVLSSINF